MADNIVLNPGAGGSVVATDDIGGIQHELVKIEYGLDGSATMVSPSTPLPVTDAVAEAALTSLAAEDFATASKQDTQTASLAAILAKLSSDPATQTTLAAILAKIIAAPSTEAKQDVIISSLASIDAGTAAALGQALMAASVPVVIASNQSSIPISAASLPLPTGGATSANQVLEIADLDLIAASASVLDDWDESDRAKVNLIVGQAGVDAGSGASSAKTQRVILATDQQAVPVTFSGLATDNTQLYSNTIVSTGAITGIDTTGYQSIIFQFSGVWNGNLIIEGSNDNATWEPLLLMDVNEASVQDVINESGVYALKSTSKFIRLNVQQLTSGSIVALVLGRTVPGIDAIDRLTLAMDKNNNMPLYVSEIDTKKDTSKALIPSDAPEPIYRFAQATSAIIFQIDTTGYQSVVVQSITAGSTVTVQMSNDGVTWVTLLGYAAVSSAPTASITSAGMYMFPAIGKFVRGLTSGAVFTNLLVFLRQQPVSSTLVTSGSPINIQSIGGNAVVAALGLNSAGSASSFTGIQVVGSNLAPGSTTVPYPIIIGGREAPSDGALGGKIRTLLTDTLGKAIVTGDIAAAQSTQNVKSVPTNDQSQFEGQSMIEILAQILLELRINNQFMAELPLVLQGQNGKFDEPSQMRQDATLFAI